MRVKVILELRRRGIERKPIAPFFGPLAALAAEDADGAAVSLAGSAVGMYPSGLVFPENIASESEAN